MQHPTILFQLAQDRRDGSRPKPPGSDSSARSAPSEHREARDRFSVRDLRWFMFRPVGA